MVQPTKSGLPLSMAVRYTLAEAVAAIERGQDDAAAWLAAGAAAPPSEGDATPSFAIPSGAIALRPG